MEFQLSIKHVVVIFKAVQIRCIITKIKSISFLMTTDIEIVRCIQERDGILLILHFINCKSPNFRIILGNITIIDK